LTLRDRRSGNRDGADRSWQAVAEWRRRKLQRQVQGRVPEHGMVSVARPGQGRDRGLAQTLQRSPPAFEHRLFDAGGIRRKAQRERRSVRFRNGPGRCATWGLRAPARCNIVLQGTIQAAGGAGSLKLTMVRRIGAGQGSNQRHQASCYDPHCPHLALPRGAT
jgi:hypothetical protein